jgi:hypothetical protein
MLAIRQWALGLIAIVAIAVFILLEPEPPEEPGLGFTPTNYAQLVETAMSDYEANAALTESAPQQQVVNGWVARDLLQIQALVTADLLDAVSEENSSGQLVTAVDPRTPALLTLAVLAVCLIGVNMVPDDRQMTHEAVTLGADPSNVNSQD